MISARWSMLLGAGVLLWPLSGCGSVSTQDNTAKSADAFFTESAKAFSPGEDLVTRRDAVTLDEREVTLAADMARAFDRAAIVFHPDFTRVDPTGVWGAKGALPDGAGAAMTFRFAGSDEDACASEHTAGPVQLQVRSGRVTLDGASVPLGQEVRNIVRHGRFHVCVETEADFDGAVSLGRVSFQFGERDDDEEGVQICHVPPGNPNDHHTITVGAPAVRAHLAHGDSLGPCEGDADGQDADQDGVADETDRCPDTAPGAEVDPDGCSCAQRDTDADGVNDCDDECPDTPNGDEVYENGCTVIVLAADAGPDREVVQGETVTIVGEAQVVQGSYDESGLQFEWQQVDGPVTTFTSNSPPLTIETTDVEGQLTFMLTVATHDGLAADSDTVVLTVREPRVVELDAGRWVNTLRMENNRVQSWGLNRDGQLIDAVAAGVDGRVTAVDLAGSHSMFVTDDGVAWDVGNGALASGGTPVAVPDVSDVVEVAALASGGLLRTAEGAVWGYTQGENAYCEIGGEPVWGHSGLLGPMLVTGLPAGVTAVAAGNFHGMALDSDGVAWVWGTRFGCAPRAVLDNVVAIAAGDTNLCLFLRGDGTAWAMGFNLHGQLGNGTTRTDNSQPTQVVGVTDVTAIAAGDRHSLFLKADGTLWGAGWNHDCRLGLEEDILPDGMTVSSDAFPIAVQLALSDVVQVAGGFSHTLAVTSDGTLWAWGLNNTGQLSGGTTTTLPWTVCTPTPLGFE